MTDEVHKSVNELAVDRTDLAVERTVMAANRTLMAWVRTATSLISFGFTIYKFLLQADSSAHLDSLQKNGPKRLGLFLIALGTISVLFGSIEYFQTLKRLDKMSPRNYKAFNYAFIMSMIIGMLGLFLITTTLLHREIF